MLVHGIWVCTTLKEQLDYLERSESNFVRRRGHAFKVRKMFVAASGILAQPAPSSYFGVNI